MNLWFIFAGIGALTLLERLSFILLLQRWTMPNWLTRGLRFVPVTVLSALIAPSILRTDGLIDVSPMNPKLIAGIVALVVARRTKNVLLTVIAGMITFWLVRTILPTQ